MLVSIVLSVAALVGPPASPAADCADNSLTLFRIRGGAESLGTDLLSRWTSAAGSMASSRGWRVQDLQADYSTSLPFSDQRAAVTEGMISAHGRCPQGKVLIAAYSHGAYVLRYAMRDVPSDVRSSIVRIDLVGDSSADRTVDGPLRGRQTDGIDTWAKRAVFGRDAYYRQPGYPDDLAPRMVQHCAAHDYICDFTAANFASSSQRVHERYAWRQIGQNAARALPAR